MNKTTLMPHGASSSCLLPRRRSLTDVPTPPVVTSAAPSLSTSDPYLPSDADVYNDADIGTKYDEEGNIQYWYNMKYLVTHTLQSSVVSYSRLRIGGAPSFCVHFKSETHVCLHRTIRLSYYLYGQQPQPQSSESFVITTA